MTSEQQKRLEDLLVNKICQMLDKQEINAGEIHMLVDSLLKVADYKKELSRH